MDHAIRQLAKHMWAALDNNKELGLSNDVVRPEIKAYVDAINSLELYYYGERKTSLEAVLS